MKHYIKKFNKRLFIVDENNHPVYTPPNFLKPLHSRNDLQGVVDGFDSGNPDEALTAFETKFNPRRKKI